MLAAIKGATYVVHTASPFPLKQPKTPAEVINPAVNGTLAVMEACYHNQVKRVVITSSYAAIAYGNNKPSRYAFTSNDWTDATSPQTSAYVKSKTLAEKAAWDFQKALPDK